MTEWGSEINLPLSTLLDYLLNMQTHEKLFHTHTHSIKYSN